MVYSLSYLNIYIKIGQFIHYDSQVEKMEKIDKRLIIIILYDF